MIIYEILFCFVFYFLVLGARQKTVVKAWFYGPSVVQVFVLQSHFNLCVCVSQAFQRQVQECLTQLELINKQYRRLARENRTDSSCRLKDMVHDGNRRWDNLQRRVAAILRRLKVASSKIVGLKTEVWKNNFASEGRIYCSSGYILLALTNSYSFISYGHRLCKWMSISISLIHEKKQPS